MNPLGLAWWCWLVTLECAHCKVSSSILLGANFGGLVWLLQKKLHELSKDEIQYVLIWENKIYKTIFSYNTILSLKLVNEYLYLSFSTCNVLKPLCRNTLSVNWSPIKPFSSLPLICVFHPNILNQVLCIANGWFIVSNSFISIFEVVKYDFHR
jgi:hypothetical protein